MPNAKVLEEKQAIVKELAEKIKSASSGVLVDYKGISVEADTKLRREMRSAGVEYAVIKNTLTSLACKEVGFEDLIPFLNGTSALAISKNDAIAPAKILNAYAKKSGDKFKIKAGFVEGKVISADGVKALADLPPREVLIAKVLGGMNAPISGFVNVLNGNIRGLVVALNAIAEKKANA
ncbi:MAG: 50S ribosomal protein L10 [Clostridiales bacterium]|nr:50S ribosomal protein L10 [Clostridiales bacterium]